MMKSGAGLQSVSVCVCGGGGGTTSARVPACLTGSGKVLVEAHISHKRNESH